MLQTDSSQAGATAGASAPDARNDVDAVPAGSMGPEGGNVITGSGTISAPAGADSGANVTVVAVQGQSGGAQLSPAAAGPLQVQGRYGTLTIDAEGNYSYVRNAGTPDGAEDVFTYTIADASGAHDSATLTILLGRQGTAAEQSVAQVLTTNDGVVVLPAGVELSDIRVVGRDLVITLPDGGTMTIPNGAVFVPQLVIGDVEVPPANLAALLIESEPQPAAGTPQSSGGNFGVDVPELDPGVPLGDLLPPTDFGFVPPVFEEVGQFIEADEPPTVIIETPDNPAGAANAVATVNEAGLPARGAEPAGSNSSANSELTSGTIHYTTPDGFESVTVNGTPVVVGTVIESAFGRLTITGIENGSAGSVSYTYELLDNTSGDATADVFQVVVTDADGDSATASLTVNIIDDVPTANNDSAGLSEGGPSSVTFDVDLNDVTGADGLASRTFTSLSGTYGTITLNADGTQTYTLNSAGVAAINALAPGATLTDTFSYTLTDGDGDADPATLTITLTGTDDPVVVRDLTPALQGGDSSVDEDDLAAGSDASKEPTTVTGTFSIEAADGVQSLTVGGTSVIANGVFTPATVTTPLGNTLQITAYDAATGAVSYSYTLNAAEAHASGAGENSLFDNLTVTLVDADNDTVSDTLSIGIVDDVPTASNDAAAQGAENAAVTVDVLANDGRGADGVPNANVALLPGTLTGAGTLANNGDGTFTYTPAAGEEGTVTFQYRITDADGDRSIATVTITLQPDSTPTILVAQGTDTVVDEAALPTGSNPSSNGEFAGGTLVITTGSDSVGTLVVNGVDVTNGGTVNGAHGVLTVTGSPEAGYSYSYELTTPATDLSGPETDDFAITVTDSDGDPASTSLSIEIIDDTPTANDDAFAIVEGDADNAISFDVDVNDVPGADGTGSRTFTSLNGTYGTITLNGDGTQTYTLNATGIAAINGLAPGATLTDTFSYTLTDGDGDADPATVTITLQGTDDGVTITDLTPSISGGDAVVDEDDLPGGSDATKESLTDTGNLTISAPDGVQTLSVNGVAVIINGVFTPATIMTPLGNTLNVTGYDAATGVVSYSYTVLAAETHPAGNGESPLFEDLTVSLTDADSDTTTDTLSIGIVDDVPTAEDDSHAIVEGDPDNAISFNVDLNDVPGADGTGSRAFTSLTGAYGTITLNGDGTQTYTLNATGIAALNALGSGETLTDTFTYTLTDGDGDADPATLTITLQGGDDGVTITGLDGSGAEEVVDEADLADGSSPDSAALVQTGSFSFTAPDGLNDVIVGGVLVIDNGAFVPGQQVVTAFGTLTVTGFTPVVSGGEVTGGTLSYSYTLTDNTLLHTGGNDGSLTQSFAVVVTDADGDSDTASLDVTVIDDAPAASDDAYTITEGDLDNAISFDVDLNDVAGADGTGSRSFTSLTGTYGTITLNGDGTQTYTLNPTGIAAINALAPGATLTDTFSYTLSDGDGDSDPATLTITLQGTDDGVTITNLTPAVDGGEGRVDEDDLPDGSDTAKESLSVTGTFNISAPDGLNDLTVGGVTIISNGSYVGGTVTTALGNQIVFTGYDSATGELSYTYTLLDNEAHAAGGGENSLFDSAQVVLTDTDGDTASDSLVVEVVDDVPAANDDSYTILEGDADNAISFDVDLNDVPGADGTQSRTFTSLSGTYGTITLNGDGTQTYTLNATGMAALSALAPGATLTDTFTYTLTDGDGDSDPAMVTVTLQGQDDPPVITNLTPAISGGEGTVDEDDLPDGSDTSKESLSVSGTFNVSAADGIDDLVVGTTTVISNGTYVGGTVVTPLGNQIVFTGFNAATGELSYTYTLLDNEVHANGGGENSRFDDVTVSLTDADGDLATDTLSVRIIDDVPMANDDAFTIVEGDADNAISFDVDLNDVPGADGTGSRAFTSLNGTYGTITLNGDGTQTYTLNATGIAAINALAPGATLTDTFTYTLTDGDADSDPATVTITLQGSDDGVTITDLTPALSGGDAVVDEDDLPSGSDTTKESLTATGDFTISAPDGVQTLSLNGVTVISNGVFTAATITTPLGNTLNVTGYNASTGVVTYTYTLAAAETHPNANGQNDLFDNMTVTLTDTDNETTSSTLSVRIVDDVPTANNDTATQGSENSTVAINAFANDVFGADGVDIDNNPNVAVTFTQPAQGTVSYNPSSGLFTFTPAAGQQGSTSFTYTITDADGDQSTASVTINLQPDSAPQVVNVTAAVDDEGLSGGIPGSTDGSDLVVPNTDGDNSERTFTGTMNVNFGGDTGSVSFANLHNTFGMVGTEYVRYSWSGTTLTATVNATASDGVTAQARAGTALFTVNLTPSGTYTVTLLDNVLHAAGSTENDATVVLNYRAADNDGDVSTAGTLTITFDDDMPVAIAPQAITSGLDNGGGDSVSASLDSDGNVANNFGADGPGGVIFTAASISALTAQSLTHNSQALSYQISNNGQTLTGYVNTNGTAGFQSGSDTAVFTVQLQPGGSNIYTVTMHNRLDSLIDIDFNNGGYNFVGGNEPWAGFNTLANDNSADLLLTPIVNGVSATTANTNANSGGIDNGFVDNGEAYRLDFVTDLTGDNAGTNYEDPGNADHVFEGHYTTNGASALIVSTTSATVQVAAFDDPDGNNVVGDGVQEDVTAIAISYGGATSNLITSSGNYTVGGRTFGVTFNADGTVNVSNVEGGSGPNPGGTRIAAFTADGYNSLTFTNVGSDSFRIGDFGAAIQSAEPVTFTVPVSIVDADGDVVGASNAISITAGSSTGTTLAAPSSQQLKSTNSANSNTVLLGAIAAAGLVSAPAGAQQTGVDLSQVSTAEFTGLRDGSDLAGAALSSDYESRSPLTEQRLADEPAAAVDPSEDYSGAAAASTNTLADAQAQDHPVPTELLQAMDMPAAPGAADAAPLAQTVAMPSAEALASALEAKAAGGEQAQQTGEVGRVLADALAGGQGPDLNALIEAATGGVREHPVRVAPEPGTTHGEAATDATASECGAAVPGWDSSVFAGFTQPHAFSMEALMAHPDAAPAAHAS